MSFMGCSIPPRIIHLEYVPEQRVSTVPGADKVGITLRTTADSDVGHKVGIKINLAGWEFAQIDTEDNIPDLLTSSLGTELKNRGFMLGPGPVEITLKLTKFCNTIYEHFWSAHIDTEVAFSVVVKRQPGIESFTKNIHAIHSESRMFFPPTYAETSLETALEAAIGRLVADPEFITSLLAEPKQGVRVSH